MGCSGHNPPNYYHNAGPWSPIYPVSYSIAKPTAGSLIQSAKWAEVVNTINSERARRGNAAMGNPVYGGKKITASDINSLSAHINYYWSDGIYSSSTTIYASHLNYVIDKVVYCGTVCVCNCNYCTCNCNYCTCNCNYSCTCNCNYSDIRLKTNIKFLRKENDINVYSFNYVWDLETTCVGVIAQELLGTEYKHSVILNENGFYSVDYSQLPINLEK